MQTALHRPNSRRTGWLVPVQAAGISEVTVHREKETYLCVIPQVPQVYYYYFTVENFQGSKEKKTNVFQQWLSLCLEEERWQVLKEFSSIREKLLVWKHKVLVSQWHVEIPHSLVISVQKHQKDAPLQSYLQVHE